MKKNITLLLLSAAVLTLFAGCNKAEMPEAPAGAKVVKASIEAAPATKTTLDRTAAGGKIAWASNDAIKINGKVYNCTPSADNPTIGTFTADSEVAVPNEQGKYVACYPYTLMDSGEVVLNSSQLWETTNMAKVFPMYAETDNLESGLQFKNICGLLEITLKGTKAVSFITVSDRDKAVSGPCTIDADGNAVIKDLTTKASVKLDCQNTVLTSEGVTFYVAIPAGSYDLLKISVDSNDGNRWTAEAVKTAVIERNKIYSLEFTPNLGSNKHEGVQLWANGPYWATTNIGGASATDSGLYFSWGNVDGYIWDGSTLDGKMSGYQFIESPWYEWTPGGQIDEGSSSNPAKLDAAHDAAASSWGDGWRMPTLDEAMTLAGLYSEYDEDSNSVLIYSGIDGSQDYIQVGLTGYFGGASFSNTKLAGLWTNECRGKNTQAYIILLNTTTKLGNNGQKRWCGFNIRPVRDTKPE